MSALRATAAVWDLCQERELVLITNNRNADDADSLEMTIRQRNTQSKLPVLTIANPEHIRRSRDYAQRVVESLLDALERIESLRGTGRLYLPWNE